MRSRQTAGHAAARLSRHQRTLEMFNQSWHEHWLALDNQRIRHLDAWCEINADLERRPGWFALSDAEKADAQRVSGLSEKDELLRVLHRRVARTLRKMPTGPSSDYDGVLANLRVAERLIAPEENAIVYAILSRAVRDLGAIRGTS